jgi:hypothetical protein
MIPDSDLAEPTSLFFLPQGPIQANQLLHIVLFLCSGPEGIIKI